MLRAALLCAALVLAGCGSRKTAEAARTYRMGETVQAGPLIYTISQTEWLDQLGEGLNARLPKNRFLVVRLSITNSGVRRIVVPGVEVVDAQGRSHAELDDAQGLDEWMGVLRSLDPAQTEHGKVVFDVASGSYRLRVADDGDPEERKTALVELPYQAPLPVTPNTSAVPGPR